VAALRQAEAELAAPPGNAGRADRARIGAVIKAIGSCHGASAAEAAA
jgi:hypothetical protein